MDLTKINTDIPQIVCEWGEKYASQTSFTFVSVLSYRYGEIVERSFGLRRYSKKGVLITEVLRRATGNKSDAVAKNLLFSNLCGYIPVFEKKDRYAINGYGMKIFDEENFDKWYQIEKPCGFFRRCLNEDILKEITEFKYCGYTHGDVIEYLNKYRQNPLIEFFGKLELPLSSMLISRAKKSKQFRKYLFKNASTVRRFGSRATIYAYNHGMTINEAAKRMQKTRKALLSISAIKGHELDCERIINYCDTNEINYYTYNDYLTAIIALGLDLKDTKNIYPLDFNTMHDLRIAEYESQKAKADRLKRQELYEQFAKAGKKALAYEYSNNEYSIIAPKDIADLVAEGKALNHCVGRMGYDKKMANGDVVIMFVRHSENITIPFVTIEYSLQRNKLLQAYGLNNTRPPIEAIAFINEWVEAMKMNEVCKNGE